MTIAEPAAVRVSRVEWCNRGQEPLERIVAGAAAADAPMSRGARSRERSNPVQIMVSFRSDVVGAHAENASCPVHAVVLAIAMFPAHPILMFISWPCLCDA